MHMTVETDGGSAVMCPFLQPASSYLNIVPFLRRGCSMCPGLVYVINLLDLFELNW